MPASHAGTGLVLAAPFRINLFAYAPRKEADAGPSPWVAVALSHGRPGGVALSSSLVHFCLLLPWAGVNQPVEDLSLSPNFFKSVFQINE